LYADCVNYLYELNDCNHTLKAFYAAIHTQDFLQLRMTKTYCSEKPWVEDRFRALIRQPHCAWQNLQSTLNRATKRLRSRYYSKRVKSLWIAS